MKNAKDIQPQPKKKRGGRRPGAGRPKGSVNSRNRPLAELARAHTHKAIEALVAIVSNPQEGAAARVSAAVALLDRGYGKPWQAPAYEAQPMANAERESGSGAAQAPDKPEADNVVPIFDVDELRKRYGQTPRGTGG